MELWINTETGEVTDTLPDWISGYGDTEPWKKIQDISHGEVIVIIGRLQKRIAALEAEAYSGPEDVSG
jgi:hypothetical protein